MELERRQVAGTLASSLRVKALVICSCAAISLTVNPEARSLCTSAGSTFDCPMAVKMHLPLELFRRARRAAGGTIPTVLVHGHMEQPEG